MQCAKIKLDEQARVFKTGISKAVSLETTPL